MGTITDEVSGAERRVSRWNAWRPDEYVREYLGQHVAADEQAAIPFQVDFLRGARRRYANALEYGCGPTLMRAIACAPYVGSLDMADRLDATLRHVQRWISGERSADDWQKFTEYVLRCEGVGAPTCHDILAREQCTRRVVAGLLHTDARARYALGPGRIGHYDLLVSSFCLDCISGSQAVWRRCLRNVFAVLKPGGAFVLMSLEACRAYRVGDCWFPAANIRADDLECALLACAADPQSLTIVRRDVAGHAEQGYEAILLASGYVKGGMGTGSML
jgi:SAM-dependent methyltransferase